LTSVKKVFHWGDVQQKAFDALKQKISLALVLALPDLRQPFEIQMDASDYAMGVVLLQHVFTVTIKVVAVMTFQMDGFSITISFGYQV